MAMSEEVGKLRLVVNAAQLKLEAPIYSSTVIIQQMPWKLKLISEGTSLQKDQGFKEIVLGLFVQCMPKNSDQSTYAQVIMRVKNHNNEKHIIKSFTRKFTAVSNDGGYSSFVKLSDILDPNLGFIKDGKVTLETQIQIQNNVGDNSSKVRPVIKGMLDTFVLCPSCNKEFEVEGKKMPMSLRCGHTFCLDCLEKSQSKSDETFNIACKTCHQLQSSSRQGDLWFPNHSMVSIITNVASKSEFFCREHQKDKDYYCYDDDTLVCIYCAYCSKHAGHSCKHVEEARKDKHEALRKMKFPFSSLIADVDRRQQFLQDKIEMLKAQEINVLKLVDDSHEQLCAALQKQKELLFKDVETQMLDLSGSLRDNAVKLEEKQLKVKEVLKEYSVWQNLPVKEMLEKFGEMQSSLLSLPALCDCKDLPQKPDSLPKLDFEVPCPAEVLNFSRFGNVVMTETNLSNSNESNSETQDYGEICPKKRKTLA